MPVLPSLCLLHLIAVNTHPYPFFATLRLDNLNLPSALLPPAATTNAVPVTRLFRGSCNAKDGINTGTCDLNATVYPNGSAVLTDVYDIESTNVYRVGCDYELLRKQAAPGDLCLGGVTRNSPDCGFEMDDLSRGMYMPSWAETMLLEFNTTDYRQYVALDSADPYHGRHSARINAPNSDVMMMPVQTSVDAGFRVGQGRDATKFSSLHDPVRLGWLLARSSHSLHHVAQKLRARRASGRWLRRRQF